MMTRANMFSIALGGLVLASTPFAANAQSGDALVRAERACSGSGASSYSSAYDTCVDSDRFDRGAPDVAYNAAREAGEGADTVQALSVVDEAPHIAVARDAYGFGYDHDGNLLDAGGYVIRPVPLRP